MAHSDSDQYVFFMLIRKIKLGQLAPTLHPLTPLTTLCRENQTWG